MDTTTHPTTASHRALGRATGALLPDGLELGAARLIVTDLDRSIEYYEQVIGLVVLERADDEVILGTPDGTHVLELELREGARRAGRHAGLYHVALLYPSREELARVVTRIAASRTMIDGASDHGTHEAIYLPDPDGNGLELAADRPRDTWPNLADIEEIRPRPLDMQALLATIAGEEPLLPAADGLVVGHLHVHVGDIAEARAFYVDVVGFELVTSLDVAAFVSAGGYHHHLAFNTWKGVGVGPAPDDAVGLRFWSATLPTAADVVELEQRLEAAGQRHERTPEGTLVTWDPWGIELRVSAR
jgi:catechol 2,3-dioxygenase